MDMAVSMLAFLALGFGMAGIGFALVFAIMCKDVGFKKALKVMKTGVTAADRS